MAETTPATPPGRSGILTTPIGSGGGKATGEGVDRRLAKRFWTGRRIAAVAGGVVVLSLVVWAFTQSLGGRRLRVQAERLTVSTVAAGPFQEYVPVTGNVMPRTTVYLDAVEGGRVEEIFVLEGATVERGTPLLRLSNNDLQLRLINADAQRLEQINRVQDMQFRMEQNALDLRQQLAQMDYQIRRLERLQTRNEELLAIQGISRQEYDSVRDELDYWTRNRTLTLEGYRQDSLRMSGQLMQMQESVRRMEANYDVIESILGNLTVRAPVAGQVTALNVELGELHTPGSQFGQIDMLDGFKVRAGVDEFYIARVHRDQPATTLPIGGTEYPMVVTRVYPQVSEGRFQVDLEFEGEPPPGIRRGQSVRFRLEMSEPAEALLLPMGGFFQATGGNWIYVLDGSGQAVRREIRVGRRNPQFLEVVEGLEPGDRVVTSGYDTFGDAERLILE
jgi:HlyD family secretion protein